MNPIEIIAEASAKMAEIHKQAAEAQKALLLNLHVKCGFSSKEDFITAFNAANGTQPAPRKQEKKPGPKPAAKPAAAKPAAAKKETATPQAAPNKPAKRKKHKRDRYPCHGGIRTRNPSKQMTADPRLRLFGHFSTRKINFTLDKAIKAQTDSRGVALLFL